MTSGWSIESVDIPVAVAAQHANGIEGPCNGTLDVIVLPSALPAAVRGPAGTQLDRDADQVG